MCVCVFVCVFVYLFVYLFSLKHLHIHTYMTYNGNNEKLRSHGLI